MRANSCGRLAGSLRTLRSACRCRLGTLILTGRLSNTSKDARMLFLGCYCGRMHLIMLPLPGVFPDFCCSDLAIATKDTLENTQSKKETRSSLTFSCRQRGTVWPSSVPLPMLKGLRKIVVFVWFIVIGVPQWSRISKLTTIFTVAVSDYIVKRRWFSAAQAGQRRVSLAIYRSHM